MCADARARLDQPKVKLLEAKRSIPRQMPLRDKPEVFFAEKEFDQDRAPRSAFRPEDMPKLAGKFLKRNLPRGSFVTDDDLTDEMGLGEAALVHSMRRVAGIRVR